MIEQGPHSETPIEASIDELAQQFMDQQRLPEPPTIDDYADRYPEYAEQIHKLFPTIVGMEKLRVGKQTRRNDGRVRFGPHKIQHLGDYRIVREIARGGMGVVYEAQQQSLDRRVALKVLPKNIMGRERLENFVREAQMAARLHHTNIVPIYGVGEQDGFYYYVMQLIQGVSLEQYVESSGYSQTAIEKQGIEQITEVVQCQAPVPEYTRKKNKKLASKDVARIGCQTAAALQYAHDQGTLHRDIKPANLLLDREQNVWITDFGLAIHEHTTGQDEPTAFSGTLRYLPPERFQGTYDRQSEIYSLGISLIELATGKPAFDAETDEVLAEHIRCGRLAPQWRCGLPRDLVAVLERATASEPDDRYKTAGELQSDLERFIGDHRVSARSYSTVETLVRWARRRPALATMTGIVIALLITISVVTSVGYWKVNAAYAAEIEQRLQAEQAFRVADAVVDRIFFGFNPDSSFVDDVEVHTETAQPVLSKQAAQMLSDLLVFYEQLAGNRNQAPEMRAKSALAAGKVGEIYERLGDYQAAIGAFENSLNLLQGLPADDNQKRQLQVAKLLNHKGLAHAYQDQSVESQAAFESAIQILNHPSMDPNDDSQLELAMSHYNLASKIRPGVGPNSLPPLESSPIFRPDARVEPARLVITNLKQAIDILSEGLRRIPEGTGFHHRYSLLMAKCLREFANDRFVDRDDLDVVSENQAIDILEQLATDPSLNLYPHYQFELMETLADIDVFGNSVPLAQLDPVIDRMDRALGIAEMLVQQRPDIAEFQRGYIHTCYKMAVLYQRQLHRARNHEEAKRATDRALRYLTQCMDAQKKISLDSPDNVGHRVWQARFRLTQADLEKMRGNQRRVPKIVGEVLSTLESLPEPVASHPIVDLMFRETRQLLREPPLPPRRPPR